VTRQHLEPVVTYMISEKFKSIQGEGLYTGTPMAFIRFTGCSVGKNVCHACDTDFDKIHSFRGGGQFTAEELLKWAEPYKHICLTGGEPLDRDISPFFSQKLFAPVVHIETSGTILWTTTSAVDRYWVTVSPKPGYLDGMINEADEIKVIVPGLGSGEGWPTLNDACLWASAGKKVFLQPRNGKFAIDQMNLKFCIDAIREHPQLRLSVQMHKILGVQ
jgi:7-carboxy-7-deazaguanine synthase